MGNINEFGYISSDKVKVYPCVFRGADDNTQYDIEARLNTERNIVQTAGILSGKKSYVVSFNNNKLICIIHGYYFEFELANDDIEDNWIKDYKYINIKLTNRTIVESEAGESLAESEFLANYEDDTYGTIDANGYFYGACFTVAIDTDASYYLDISNPSSAKLSIKYDSVESASNGKTIAGNLINGSAVEAVTNISSEAQGDYSFAFGNNCKAENDYSYVFGNNLVGSGPQVVFGNYNESDASAALIIGNGTSDNRSNLLVIGSTESYLNTDSLKINDTLEIDDSTINTDLSITTTNSINAANGTFGNIIGETSLEIKTTDETKFSITVDTVDNNKQINVDATDCNSFKLPATTTVEGCTLYKDLEDDHRGVLIQQNNETLFIEPETTIADMILCYDSTAKNIKWMNNGDVAIGTANKITINNFTETELLIVGGNADTIYDTGIKITNKSLSDIVNIGGTGNISGFTDITCTGKISGFNKISGADNSSIENISSIAGKNNGSISGFTDITGSGTLTINDIYATGNITKVTDITSETSGTISGFGKIEATTFNATSDKRLKENIIDYKPGKSILDLPIYKYDFIDGPKNQIGCLAQDLQEICPEIVSENENGYLSIQESKLVYLLLDEVKNLKAEIEKLKK